LVDLSAQAADPKAVVSSDSDLLILVNSADEEVGEADKLVCHDGQGMLHRAFSVLLFNDAGELLIQKRAAGKSLWGDYWSNSCCSQPRIGETMDEASRRRIWEELGLRADPQYLYKFEYHAQFDEDGAEHELCWVYIGRCDGEPVTNENEISEWRFVSVEALEQELENAPESFTPWFKLEWQEIKQRFSSELHALNVAV